MKLENMTKDEKSLLLFLETCAVDQGGLVNIRHMNNEDVSIAKEWNKMRFILFGRVSFASIERLFDKGRTNWCRLSNEAFQIVSQERFARASRMWNKRNWQTTEEARE